MTHTCYYDSDGDGYFEQVQTYTGCSCTEMGPGWSANPNMGSEIYGCTDPSACNYCNNCTEDDGSCWFPYFIGCYQDQDGDGYWELYQDYYGCDCGVLGPNWIAWHPGLEGPEISGCDDPVACNYSSIATENDGSCWYPSAVVCYLDVDGDGYFEESQTAAVCYCSDLGPGWSNDTQGPELHGCMDTQACNFDHNATEHCTDCCYYGFQTQCNNPLAINYGEICGEGCCDPVLPPPVGYCCEGDCCCIYPDIPEGYSFGDVNLSGNLNVLDVVLLVNMVLSGIDWGNPNGYSPDQIALADVNQDGTIDILDVVQLVTWVLNAPTSKEDKNTLNGILRQIQLHKQAVDRHRKIRNRVSPRTKSALAKKMMNEKLDRKPKAKKMHQHLMSSPNNTRKFKRMVKTRSRRRRRQ
jgi:hypothetical protein